MILAGKPEGKGQLARPNIDGRVLFKEIKK
jgi:hypothetical protein